METAKLENCPVCKGVEHKNNVYIKEGEPVKVYVECANCGSFVARYTLLRYTSDKPYESLLRKLYCLRHSSGRNLLKEIEGFTTESGNEFEKVKLIVKDGREKRKVEEIIDQTRCPNLFEDEECGGF